MDIDAIAEITELPVEQIRLLKLTMQMEPSPTTT